MDHETLFTATKWDILKLLERKPHSPIEISKAVGSSIANVSQQLRLLELAGVVKTQRVSNRDKDKPRILYSLAGNLSYLISTSDNFVDKKVMSLSECNKIILHIWFIDDANVRYVLEKAFWKIESELEHITHLSFAGVEKGVPTLEYIGTAKLPQSIEVHGHYPAVAVRKVEKPAGLVLFERAA